MSLPQTNHQVIMSLFQTKQEEKEGVVDLAETRGVGGLTRKHEELADDNCTISSR